MNQRRIIERRVLKKSIKKKINQLLLMVIVFLLGMISVKVFPNMESFLRENIYEKSFSFLKIRDIYNRYFESNISNKEDVAVFAPTFHYLKLEEKEDGVLLTVDENSTIPMFRDGLIVYIGEEDGKSSVIVDQVDGVSVMIKDIHIKDHKIYDYLEKGEILGEVNNNTVFISFKKNDENVSYKEYF